MKIARKELPFEPIVITIETIDELKWMLAISNTSVAGAREQASNFGFDIGNEAHIQQLALWNGLEQYKSLAE